MEYTPTSALETLLHPHEPQSFFRTHWEARSLHVKRSDWSLPFAFDRKSFLNVVGQASHVKVAFKDQAGQHRESPIDGARAGTFYDAGLSICASGLEHGHEGIRRFIDALNAEVRQLGTFTMNGYLSPNDKGFGVHFDNHSVWVLQVEGAKRWHYAGAPSVPSPLTNCIYPLRHPAIALPWARVERPTDSELTEVLLEPGDMLYLPAGTWHKTEASGASLSLTLAQSSLPTAAFVAEALSALAVLGPDGRQFLSNAIAGEGDERVRVSLEAGLQAMRRALDETTVEALCAAWAQRASKLAPPPPALKAV